MQRSDFDKLPLALQVKLLADVVLKQPQLLDAIDPPRVARPPKYDGKVYRKGGFMWASEMELESLQFWQKRYQEGSQSGGPYAEKDAKRAKELGYWIAWREQCPSEPWTGERFGEVVIAPAPRHKPAVYDHEPRHQQAPARSPADDGEDDSELPF
jgi:hypothetical protein